jgi:four helix bundle protein
MDEVDLKKRTKEFALRCMKLADSLPTNRASGRVLANQLLRAGTSVGANYRAACRARSRADFIAKLGIVEEECDETIFWMELVTECEMKTERLVAPLRKEADELVRIVVRSIQTARANKSVQNPKSEIRNS